MTFRDRLRVCFPIALLIPLSLLASSCSEADDDDNQEESPASGGMVENGPSTESKVGAWYGSGADFPDGNLCLVFCENGRLFLADSPCDQTDVSDLEQYTTWEEEGSAVTTNWPKVPGFDFVPQGDTALLSFPGSDWTDLPMDKVATDSPLCTDESLTELGPEDN